MTKYLPHISGLVNIWILLQPLAPRLVPACTTTHTHTRTDTQTHTHALIHSNTHNAGKLWEVIKFAEPFTTSLMLLPILLLLVLGNVYIMQQVYISLLVIPSLTVKLHNFNLAIMCLLTKRRKKVRTQHIYYQILLIGFLSLSLL